MTLEERVEELERITGAITEVHNTKMDLDAHNVQNPSAVVIESQMPTADNSYTWYRLYSDGWVEQGGYVTGSGAKISVTLIIEMSNVNYHINLTGFLTSKTAGSTTSVSTNAGEQPTTTTSFCVNNFVENGSTRGDGTAFWWTVSGIAA